MFEISASQKQAFWHATGGISLAHFNHTILFFVVTAATLWLVLVCVKTMRNREKEIQESLLDCSLALFLYTLVGVVIFYI